MVLVQASWATNCRLVLCLCMRLLIITIAWLDFFSICSKQAGRESVQASHMPGRESRVRWEQAADGELQRNRQIKAPLK